MTAATSRLMPPSPEVWLSPDTRYRVSGARRSREPLLVHRKLPGYAVTPLTSCPGLAAQLAVREVWVKDESSRLGLPSFKMLGASYAAYRALTERLGHDVAWDDIGDLRAALAALRPFTLAAATDGNHGRAVARMARLLGFVCAIYVPEGTVTARIAAIESEGARVTVVHGDYDAAVRRSAEDAGEKCLVISDTSWPGYTRTPTWVIEGYSTIFAEVADQLAAAGAAEPDVVAIPVGVGALAAATVRHFKSETAAASPFLIGVEPASANCVMRSLGAGRLTAVPGPHASIMAGLNCGTPSEVAWPFVSAGFDAMIAIDDEYARRAMRGLAAEGITAGETGAAALGGLLAVTDGTAPAAHAKTLGLRADASVLLICTEGATDPEAWEQIVGRPAPAQA